MCFTPCEPASSSPPGSRAGGRGSRLADEEGGRPFLSTFLIRLRNLRVQRSSRGGRARFTGRSGTSACARRRSMARHGPASRATSGRRRRPLEDEHRDRRRADQGDRLLGDLDRHLHTPADAVRNYPANSIDNVLASSLSPAGKPCKLGSSRAELRDLPRVPRAA